MAPQTLLPASLPEPLLGWVCEGRGEECCHGLLLNISEAVNDTLHQSVTGKETEEHAHLIQFNRVPALTINHHALLLSPDLQTRFL